MKKNAADIIMNPVRQRIVQYLILNKTGAVNDIASELSDVPKPSIYRHISILSEYGLIKVVSEKAVRGAVEKTYTLAKQPMGSDDNANMSMLIQNSLMTIAANFAQYFRNENVNPQKDMLSVASSTLLLSDEEFMEFMSKIGQVYSEVINNKPSDDRKTRCITFISSPDLHKKEK